MSLTAADVAEIMRLVEQSGFDELTLEIDGTKLSLRRGAPREAPLAAAQRPWRRRCRVPGGPAPVATATPRVGRARSRSAGRALAAAGHVLSRAEARRAALRGGRRRRSRRTRSSASSRS